MRVRRHVEDLEAEVDGITGGVVGEGVASCCGFGLVEGDAPAVSGFVLVVLGGLEVVAEEVRRGEREREKKGDDGDTDHQRWPALC